MQKQRAVVVRRLVWMMMSKSCNIRSTPMPTGTVNRFNKIKGYGFITADHDNTEVFVHFSEVEMAGYKELKIGQRISYDDKTGDRGPYAINVKIVTD